MLFRSHLYNNYKGWDRMNESVNESSNKEIRGVFQSIEDANKYGLLNLVKNTRNDKELQKFWKASVVLTKKLEKHLHKTYPDWEKRNG